jgi:hypothetical protein
MDLRDRFAAHFAAALVDALADSGQIARRAYDLAEAMMIERARRIDEEEGSAIAGEPRRASASPGVAAAEAQPGLHSLPGALLDEPVLEPDPGHDDDLDPSWLEPPYDPSWDVETRWSTAAEREGGESAPQKGPGLARTTPEPAGGEERKERSA